MVYAFRNSKRTVWYLQTAFAWVQTTCFFLCSIDTFFKTPFCAILPYFWGDGWE